jgi:hypothetical protein
VTEWGRVQVEKQAVEGNDPHGGHRYVCEGDKVLVGVWRVRVLKERRQLPETQ